MGLLFGFIIILSVGIKEKRANSQVKGYFKPVTQLARASLLGLWDLKSCTSTLIFKMQPY